MPYVARSNNGIYRFNPLGGNTYQPFVASAGSTGSNKDVLSRFVPTQGYETGALNSVYKPVLYKYLEITTVGSGTGGTSTGDYYLQLATGASGSGGANDTTKQTTYGTKSFIPNVPSFVGSTVYYGFYVAPGTGNVNFYRGDNSDNTANPNGIYVDGTSVTTGTPGWNTTSIYGEIQYASVPSAPGASNPSSNPTPTVKPTVSVGSDYATISFPTPVDNGGSSIDGYRVLVSTDMASWYSTDVITAYTTNLGITTLTVDSYYASSTATVATQLQPATNYYFQVAAINEVARKHLGAVIGTLPVITTFKDVNAHTGSNSLISDVVTTLGYGKRFTSTTATTDIRYASRYTGNSSDSVIVEGVTYTGWTRIVNVKRGSQGGWTNLSG